MAYYETINLVAGDDRPEINLTLKDSNTAISGSVLDPDDSTTWALIDISDPAVGVKFRALGTATILDTLSCVKVAPYTNGVCFMPWNPTTLDIKEPHTVHARIIKQLERMTKLKELLDQKLIEIDG